MEKADQPATAQAGIDVPQAQRFLRALCNTKIGEADPTLVFQCVDDAKKDRPGLTEHKAGTLFRLLRYLRLQNERGAAVFFQVNSGGRGDPLVTAPRALFLDDDLKAAHRPELSALPPSATVRSSFAADGRPKTHYYWFLKEDEPLDAWLPAMQHLASVFGTDTAICKLSQPMRLPGFLHRKAEPPQRSELLTCDATRRFTIAEVVAAFPAHAGTRPNGTNGTNGANGTNGVPEKHAKIDAALMEPEGTDEKTDSRDPDDASHSEESAATFQRLCDWLKRIGEPFIIKAAKPRFIFFTRGCPRNREHKDAALIVRKSGAIFGKCFHDTCLGDKNGWRDFRTALGGWSELKRGDNLELAIRLRNELRTDYKSEIVCESKHPLSKLYRYDEKTGAWVAVSEETLTDHVVAYAGLPFGEKGTLRKLNQHDLRGIPEILRALCARPAFFEQGVQGALFTNGFLSIHGRKLELLPHDAEHRARSAYQFAYDPKATAPRWEQHLREVFANDPRAEEKTQLLQEFFGTCILGVATRFQKSLFLTGEGSNGKSVCLKVLKALFPPSLIATVKPQDMEDDYSRAMLYNKHVNIVTEVPERELLHTAGFKAMVDGSLIKARPIREAPIVFSPTAAHVFACNSLPSVKDHTTGFWRRILVIAFGREFTEAEQDEQLPEKIIATELAGICNWCLVGGARALEQGGYTRNAASDESRAGWREQNDPVALFLRDEAEECSLLEGNTTEELFAGFRAWAEENGHHRMSKEMFGKRLGQIRPEITHTRKKVEGKTRMVWCRRILHSYSLNG